VVIAPPAAKPIDGGLPGPGLLAHVLVSKYKDHLPLHRLSGIYARSGVDLKASTLGDWVAAGTDGLEPIARAIWRNALAAHLLQSDDTGIKVLDKDHPNRVKRGHLWVYLGDGKWCAFVYTPDWKGEWPQTFLAERKGWLQVDGYAGYDDLFSRAGATAIEVSCWAHARRGFVETLEAGDLRAAIPVELIRQLYAIERAARTLARTTRPGESGANARRRRSSLRSASGWQTPTTRSRRRARSRRPATTRSRAGRG
jgi:transposase